MRARGMLPCVRVCPKFGHIGNARARNASLRARRPKVSAKYAMRAQGMRPCVREYQNFRPLFPIYHEAGRPIRIFGTAACPDIYPR